MRYAIFICLCLNIVFSNGCASKNDTYGLQGTVHEISRKFNGKIGNLMGDGKITTLNSECRGFGRGPAGDGKYWAEFDLTPTGPNEPPTEFHLYFVFQPLRPRQMLITNTDSNIVGVWLFRSDKNYSNTSYIVRNIPEQLHQRGGEKMTGRVAIKWNTDADFVIGANLTMDKDKSTWVQGEFVGSTKTKLNPMLYDWPTILLFQESK